MGHSERDHALLGPSNAYQWAACPPSARLSEGLPDTGSEAAKEGTLAHELAELKLRNYFFSQDFGKRKLAVAVKKLKEDPLWNDEMMGYTDDYLDYVRAAALSFKTEPSVAVEKRVDISEYVPECFGTADCLLIGGGIIHVIDFKYGKNPSGRVEAENNLQMQLYALGAWTASRMLYRVDRVRMSIVQPRLPDGITEWEIPLEKLLETGEWIRERAQLAWKGEGEYHPDEKTCRFCRAKSRCRARAEKNLELAFAPEKGKLPPLISNEEMGKYLLQGQDVAKWLSDLQECALQECLAGHDVPGWKAVEGRSTRKWTDMDAAFGRLMESGINAAVLWERKPVTLAQIEKIVGKKDFAECVGEYVVKEPGKPALVQESDNRPAITNRVAAAEAFKEEES
ncbi:MAG TPA: DUF2800 domain-containing protein [Candidatus Eisenbergiella merdipullorum]|uniref:DUF2800 domain-containing protein n=1 Tax=Candidatus Eisenbergiella merdipullorum TaxID=2838553 RepID=A0A9D2I4H7_9FIRM|nr:DUF2800 domain-containing protein [Candidatus Eisenbergiella merdipullorum]